MSRPFWTTLTFAAVSLLTHPAFAQNAEPSPEAQVIAALPHMIRWSGVALSLVIVLGAWLLLRFTGRLVDNLGEAFADKRLLFQKLNTFLQFTVYLVATISAVLLSFRVSTQVLAVLGGTMAVAIGFALKDLAASVVAGVMMLFDRPFQVGDRVTFGGEFGDVTSLGLRSVNMQVVVDFHIGLDQDVRQAMDLAREATAISRYVYLAKPIEVVMSQVLTGDLVALRVRLKAYVLDTRFEKAFETDVTLRVLEAFEQADIGPPAILHRRAGPSSIRSG
jgi:small-conductance mechanosensitive channel